MVAEQLKRSVESMGMAPVEAHLAVAKEPKVVDLSSIDVYPSKYKIVAGEILLKSINIEDVERQREAIANLKTTILLGDFIKLDFKFGHYKGGEWSDYFVKGVYKVREFVPNTDTREILVKLSKT
jgi:hypothetical protein